MYSKSIASMFIGGRGRLGGGKKGGKGDLEGRGRLVGRSRGGVGWKNGLDVLANVT